MDGIPNLVTKEKMIALEVLPKQILEEEGKPGSDGCNEYVYPPVTGYTARTELWS